MARCAYCQAETQLYEGAIPICLQCDALSKDKRAAKTQLTNDLHKAMHLAEAATAAFRAATSEIPSSLPHPDGVQRIQNASREMALAREEMTKAQKRLNEFLERGIVPQDLKRSG
jgi:hypothetical protein